VKVLLTGTSFLPTYGGPAYSVSGLAAALAEAGVEVGLWAPDGSAVSSPLVGKRTAITCLGGHIGQALQRFGGADVLHDNGIWLPHNHHLAMIAVRQRIARLVSLRGMLEPWARNHKKWKKKLAWCAYQRRDLITASAHHATAECEAQSVRELQLGSPIYTIPNGVDVPDAWPEAEGRHGGARPRSPRVALFLSRLHPIKGLPMLVEAWGRLRPAGWVLSIAGPDEAGHRAKIERLVRSYGLTDRVHFLGPIDQNRRASVFAAADLLVLPTHSENFGMVVAEGLAHGLPVLTTKGTPWSKLEECRCGWWVDATADGITGGLRQAFACEERELRAMGARGRDLVADEFRWSQIAEKFISVYARLTSKM
jgi:glycosyltransferase involved in cell wall biosynthesis